MLSEKTTLMGLTLQESDNSFRMPCVSALDVSLLKTKINLFEGLTLAG